MRDLRQASHEGPRVFLHSLATFPRRHPFLVASVILGIVAVLGILGYVETGQKVTHVERNVTNIEAASPCLAAPKSEACKASFEQAVLTITHAEACAILRKAGLEVISCAHARLRQEHRRHTERAATRAAKGGDALQTPHHSAHQHPGPRGGGTPQGSSTPPAASPVQEASGPAQPGHPSTVHEVAEGVAGSLEGATNPACEATNLTLPTCGKSVSGP